MAEMEAHKKNTREFPKFQKLAGDWPLKGLRGPQSVR